MALLVVAQPPTMPLLFVTPPVTRTLPSSPRTLPAKFTVAPRLREKLVATVLALPRVAAVVLNWLAPLSRDTAPRFATLDSPKRPLYWKPPPLKFTAAGVAPRRKASDWLLLSFQMSAAWLMDSAPPPRNAPRSVSVVAPPPITVVPV